MRLPNRTLKSSFLHAGACIELSCVQALVGAQKGVQTLQDRGVAWLRPPDYYAEMVKSDGHMANIKQRLVYEQKQIEEAEERYTF